MRHRVQEGIIIYDIRDDTHTHISIIDPPKSHRTTRMTGPDCAVMCNSINTHTYTLGRINASGIE